MKNIIIRWITAALFTGVAALAARAQSPRLDPSFAITSAVDSTGGRASINEMVLQPDGKLVVHGSFRQINGHPAPGLARLLPDGRVDTTFAAPPFYGRVDALALQADGKLLVGGRFTTVGGQSRIGIARLLPNGRLDPGFRSPFGGGPLPFAYSSVSKIIIHTGRGDLVFGFLIPLGSFGIGILSVVRLVEATGAIDTTFQPGFDTRNNATNDVLVQPNGHLVFSGSPRLFNGRPCTVWGALPDGALDPAFVPLPGINTYSATHGLARDPATGNIYVVRERGPVLDREPVRLLPNGALDPTFRVSAASFPQSFGGVASMAVQPNGRLLLGGGFYVAGGYHGSCRLLPSGALDPSYDPSRGPDTGNVAKVLVQPDGKLLFAGLIPQAGGFALDGLARMLDPNVLLAARASGPAADDLAAWPVPARDVLHLRLPPGRVARHLSLLDALGRVVRCEAVLAGESAPTLPVAGLLSGGYLLRVDFAEGAPAYRRVAVE